MGSLFIFMSPTLHIGITSQKLVGLNLISAFCQLLVQSLHLPKPSQVRSVFSLIQAQSLRSPNDSCVAPFHHPSYAQPLPLRHTPPPSVAGSLQAPGGLREFQSSATGCVVVCHLLSSLAHWALVEIKRSGFRKSGMS